MMLAMFVTFAFSEKLVEQPGRIGRQATLRNQIRPAQPGAHDRLLHSPALDISMVPALQYVGHLPAFELHRPRVMRPVEQSRVERFLDTGALVAEHAREQ